MHDLLPEHTHEPSTSVMSGAWVRRLGIALTILWALSGVYFVRADEEAVVLRFGRAVRPAAPPGMHVGLPWPLDRITKIRVRESRRVAVGFRIPEHGFL